MNKKVYAVSIIVIIVCFTAVGSVFVTRHSIPKSQSISPPGYIQLILNQVTILEQEASGWVVNNQGAYWGNDSLNGFPLNQLAADDRLYFYFSQNVCPPCMITTIELIKQYFPDYDHNDAVVFLSRDWPHRLRNNCYGKRLLTLQKGTLGIFNEDIPFFFKLSPEMKLTSIHIITKADFERTETYLKELSSLLTL